LSIKRVSKLETTSHHAAGKRSFLLGIFSDELLSYKLEEKEFILEKVVVTYSRIG